MLDWRAVFLVLSQCLLDSYGVWETFSQQKRQISDIKKIQKRKPTHVLQPHFWLRVLFHAFVLKPLLFVSLFCLMKNSLVDENKLHIAFSLGHDNDNDNNDNNERAESLSVSFLYFVPLCFSSSFLAWIHQICMLVFCDELFFYFWHRLLHESRYLYRHVHSLHHVSVDRIYPMHYLYVHPLEMVVGSLGWTVAMLLLRGSLSLGVISCYGFAKVFQELKAHSLQPLLIEKLFEKSKMVLCSFPQEGRERMNFHHLIHHHKKMGNYSSSFVFLDKLFHTQLSSTSTSFST